MPKRKYTKEFLEPIVKNNISIAGILREIGLKASGGNHSHISKRIKDYGIDTSHLKGQAYLKGGKPWNFNKKIPLKDILVRESKYARCHLKSRLLKEGLLENKCYCCGNGTEWNDSKLVLQLDHINGINNDNRIENLRMLCPNCHSQTKTFSGKNNTRM